MDELIKALTDEQTHAAAAMKEAEEKGEHYQGAYWEGYQDAINNAAALIYGPTPLDEQTEEKENSYTQGIKDTLDDLQDAYPEIRNSDLWAEFMESEGNQ